MTHTLLPVVAAVFLVSPLAVTIYSKLTADSDPESGDNDAR